MFLWIKFHILADDTNLYIHAIVGQARPQCADSVTVRVPQGDDMGMAEEDFEGAFGFGHGLSAMG